MKIAGMEIAGDLAELNEDVLVLPRRKSQIILTARALADMGTFEKRVPEPKPKKNFVKGKGWVLDLEDTTYVEEMKKYGELRVAYFVVMSLEPSEMVWDTVDLDKPDTWGNWEDDFKNSGFTQHECNLILGLCFQVNQLNESKLEDARASFVHGQEALADESSSPNSEQSDTPSGKPVKDGE